MGQQQSKDELLYQQVNYGNVDGIKSLRSDGAGLEWMDSEGKTPLIVACMNPGLYNVAKTLIELGANVNAYRPGRHAGTPLHHAAKRGIDQTVKLLLSHGANALMMNDDCQTPLDIARGKGYSNVVRTIEGHMCLFSGSLKEFYGPGFLELLAPQLLSRKVWVVVLPCGSRNLRKPFKLELAIYNSAQEAQPRLIIPLWKANLNEPDFSLPDPAAVVSDIASIPRRWRRRRGIKSSQQARKTRIKLAPANESDRQQLQRFCNACKGIPQVAHPTFPFNVPAIQATAPPPPPPTIEDEEMAMAVNASLQAAAQQRPPPIDSHPGVDDLNPENSYIWGASTTPKGSGGAHHEAGPSSNQSEHIETETSLSSASSANLENPSTISSPSAPPVTDEVIDDGPIHYPTIDLSDVATLDLLPGGVDEKQGDNATSSCTICLDAPVEGACIPCGHMAGCMSCMNEVKAKKWGCPVCRANIDQVVRIYAV